MACVTRGTRAFMPASTSGPVVRTLACSSKVDALANQPPRRLRAPARSVLTTECGTRCWLVGNSTKSHRVLRLADLIPAWGSSSVRTGMQSNRRLLLSLARCSHQSDRKCRRSDVLPTATVAVGAMGVIAGMALIEKVGQPRTPLVGSNRCDRDRDDGSAQAVLFTTCPVRAGVNTSTMNATYLQPIQVRP